MGEDRYGLNAGYTIFCTGFNNAGLAVIPGRLETIIQASLFDTYGELVRSKLAGRSNYWAPEIRHELASTLLKSYVLDLIRELHLEMQVELERLVNVGEWTDAQAQQFAQEKAGGLFLQLFGNLQPAVPAQPNQ